jgi:hypothetical protein
MTRAPVKKRFEAVLEVEALEQKLVLTHAGSMLPAMGPALILPPGPGPHGASGLVVSVRTDKAVYTAGSPVQITITETNTSNHSDRVLIGCQILTSFVTKGSLEIWRYRDMRYCVTGVGNLPAHQSRQFRLVWNGQFNHPLPLGSHTGTFVVHAGVDGILGSTSIRINPS